MSTAPRGMSVQEGYRLYREQSLFVNRRYQRKLVWTEIEKARLIESILRDFPIPLILLAERAKVPASYEIIDGLQRLNAIFSFIENAFPVNGQFFDVEEFARAKQLATSGAFILAPPGAVKLPRKECADLLDYQLAVTIYSPADPDQVTEVFGRINSGGKQLSDQEKRQAGLVSPFATLVRQLGSEIRGDASNDILSLDEMPEISIDSKRARQGYGLTAEDTFWCKQGVLRNSDLRDSEDEEMIADIAASILLNEPLATSKEKLDDLYKPESQLFNKVESALAARSAAPLSGEIKVAFSVLRETVEEYYSTKGKTLRNIVNPGSGNPVKAAFYSIFMAFYDLVIKEQRSPTNAEAIMEALKNLQSDMITTGHYTKTEDRTKNIDKTTGLIQKYFVRRDPPAFNHGPGLALDFENSLRRSSIETSRYEFKQGLLRLATERTYDAELVKRIIETICGIANVGPEANGFLYIGVADTKEDSARVESLDGVVAERVGQRYVVGIDREVRILGISTEAYVEKLINAIRAAPLSNALKIHVQTKVDTIEYRGKTVIRLVVPPQQDVSFLGNDAFMRDHSQTKKAEGKAVLALSMLFK